MEIDRRVTLRCLDEDLSSGWGNADHHRAVKNLRTTIAQCVAGGISESDVARELRRLPRLNSLDHPLVRQFDSSYGPNEDATSRESISGLASPHWWKHKTMQWRGAATDHSMVGTNVVWLCAAGMRKGGSGDDFYASFMRKVRRVGPQPFLPSDEDSLAVKVDEKIVALDAWKLQIHCSSLALLAEALISPDETFRLKFPAPSRDRSTIAIGELSVSVESVDVDGIEVWESFLTATIIDRKEIKAVDVAVQIARAALQQNAEEWHSTIYKENAYAFSSIIEPTAIACADELRRTGNLPDGSAPGDLRLGLHSHYARKHGLVDAQVEGSAVLSLCGYWFVPTADHTDLETCRECAERLDQIGPR